MSYKRPEVTSSDEDYLLNDLPSPLVPTEIPDYFTSSLDSARRTTLDINPAPAVSGVLASLAAYTSDEETTSAQETTSARPSVDHSTVTEPASITTETVVPHQLALSPVRPLPKKVKVKRLKKHKKEKKSKKSPPASSLRLAKPIVSLERLCSTTLDKAPASEPEVMQIEEPSLQPTTRAASRRLPSPDPKPVSPVRPARHFPLALISRKTTLSIEALLGLPGNSRCYHQECDGKDLKKRAHLREHVHTHFTRYFCECGFCNVHRRSIDRHQRIKENAGDGRPHIAICEVSLDNIEEFKAKHWPLKSFKIPKLTTMRHNTGQPTLPTATLTGTNLQIATPTATPACAGCTALEQRYSTLERRLAALEDVVKTCKTAFNNIA